MLRGYADAQLLLYIRAEVAQEADRKLASSIPSVEELGIEELTLTAPDELAVALRGCHRRHCMNE